MDQTHARAIEALQPFIHLANSNSATSPRFVANLISNATSSPQTYVFAELLETPTIQSLRSPETPSEYQGYLKLLEIFAWGTWQDYQSTPKLPKLSNEQTLKLRLLSLLSFASTIKPLTYSALMNALSLTSTADLETLVTKANYASLISARLSPATNPPTVNITAVAPLRDVQPQSLPKMVSLLTEWEARCGAVVSDLEAEIALVKANAAKSQTKERAYQKLLDEAIKRRQNAATAQEMPGGAGNGRPGNPTTFARRGARMGPGMSSNKREADDIDDDDGYWDSGEGGEPTSRMDIDEGAGSSRAGPSRQSKRVLGRKS